jgi:hypothetical protein
MDSWIRASEGYWAVVLYTTPAVLVEARQTRFCPSKQTAAAGPSSRLTVLSMGLLLAPPKLDAAGAVVVIGCAPSIRAAAVANCIGLSQFPSLA